LSTNNFYTQSIKLTDKSPVYIKNYRLPQSQLEEINNQVEKLQKENIIEPSVSSYNSPLLIVPKKNTSDQKKWRLVVDFRQLNKRIMNDKFPLTRLEDVLDTLGRAKYFSTLDMTSSFHQIELQKDSRHLTAFSTNKGHFQFKRLPFGLKISTNSFQRMLTIALTGLDASAFLYVDDIIVYGCSLKHHNSNLEKVFKRLQQYNLKLNPEKCNFLSEKVIYLGHLITAKGIQTDPSKHKHILEYPIPKNADEVRRFVAFCNYYRRFIKNFAEIAKPLNNLLKKNVTFNWTNDCNNAFENLKNKLINPPILKYPNFNEKFILTTDASSNALGAVLSQGENENEHPICYASRTLNKHELNKPIIEKELLGIHWGINYFRPYLYGRKFTVVTDHRPLVSLFTHKNPSSKLTRIRLDLMDYDFDIVFKQGKMNTNADALSRININMDKLKSLIPTNINVLTRNMKKMKDDMKKQDKEATTLNKTKSDQLWIWNSSSLSDIKNVKRLNFRNITSVHVNDNNILKEGHHSISNKLEVKPRQLSGDPDTRNESTKNIISSNKNKDIIITNKNIIIQFSENLGVNLGDYLDKLISEMIKNNTHELALSIKDEVFEHIDVNEFKNIYNKLHNNKVSRQNIIENKVLKIILFKPPKVIENQNEMKNLIKEYHATALGGHVGIKRCLNKLKQNYVWKNMSRMVKKYINDCETCSKNKITRYIKEPLVVTETPTQSFEIVTIDTVGPLRLANGYRYILTLQCELTKYIEAFPLETKEAYNVAKTLVEKFILKYGAFKTFKTDQGTEYVNKIFKEICKLLNIKHKTSTPFHHETLGTIERNHRVLNEYMLAFTHEDDWDQWIPYYVFCYNSTPHTDTNYSPFELVYGKLATVANKPMALNDQNILYNIDDYATEVKLRLQRALKRAQESLNETKLKRKNKSDSTKNPRNFEKGDYVYLKKGNKKKHEPPYEGPYKIIETFDPNSKIKIRGKDKIVHNNRLKLR